MSSSRSPPGGGKGNTAPLVVAAFLLGATMGRVRCQPPRSDSATSPNDKRGRDGWVG